MKMWAVALTEDERYGGGLFCWSDKRARMVCVAFKVYEALGSLGSLGAPSPGVKYYL